MIDITPAAITHYVERVAPSLTFEEARARIVASAKAIETAAQFGARVVKLGDGSKLELDGACVVDAGPQQRFFPSQMRRVAADLSLGGF